MKLRVLQRPLINVINNHLVEYPSPATLNYLYGLGSMAGILLVVQMVTGIFLAMHYCPNMDLAFLSVEHIMRDVNYGWLMRYIHANGASFFFAVVYIHIFRGFYYGSFGKPKGIVWGVGFGIYLLMMATAFLGYVLPMSSMSFWASCVITNLFSAIPVVGQSIVECIWGGSTVDNPTLNRFFSLHYMLPFVIAALVIIHLAALHQKGSSNPLGIDSAVDRIHFYPYFWLKDVLGWLLIGSVMAIFVFFYPNDLVHPDSYVEANPMVTPAHILPDWYFLIFYAILRSIPDKLGGVIAMFASILILFIMPLLNFSPIRASIFKPIYRGLFWLFVLDWLILGYIGQCVPESPYLEVGQVCTVFYFAWLLVLFPLITYVDKVLVSTTKELAYKKESDRRS